MISDTVNVLGTVYQIFTRKYEDDNYFKSACVQSYVNFAAKQIVLGDLPTFDGYQNERLVDIEVYTKHNLKHEIIHAFYFESGLDISSATVDTPWARNEEMIDWWALQGPKVYKAWQSAGAI